ncbi:hypothetical protein [Microbacterium esteraromaticum]|uniref:hypothetical protein n=1 Tax=Microbacterium esteraromaticum TaxID=57043 RepID=UPI001D2BED4C|nr:ABC-type transporter Mla subunit MlaD [Microbacterium esteraromaticum]
MSTEPTVPLPDLAETLAIEGTAPADPADVTSAPAPTPRTRWAAIIWGVCLAAAAWFGIWMLSDTARQDAITEWFASLSPGTMTATALLGVGVLVLIGGVVGLVRRMQRRGPSSTG